MPSRGLVVQTSGRASLLLEKYERDTVFHFGNLYKNRPKYQGGSEPGNKNKIHSFSWASRRRCKLYLRNVIQSCKVSVTLTYPDLFPFDGRETKKHLKRFRERLRRIGVSLFWVLEFQRRGAPHFHAVLSHPVGKSWLSRAWFECVGSGDEKHFHAGTKVEWIRDYNKITNYFLSYLMKAEQKTVPEEYDNVGRFWGYTREMLKKTYETYHGSYRDLCRLIRRERKAYAHKLKDWGIKWKWKGKGFVGWELSTIVEQLSPST